MVVILFAKERFYRYRYSHNKNEWKEQKKLKLKPHTIGDRTIIILCRVASLLPDLFESDDVHLKIITWSGSRTLLRTQ